jgi:hypothetical protein
MLKNNKSTQLSIAEENEARIGIRTDDRTDEGIGKKKKKYIAGLPTTFFFVELIEFCLCIHGSLTLSILHQMF